MRDEPVVQLGLGGLDVGRVSAPVPRAAPAHWALPHPRDIAARLVRGCAPRARAVPGSAEASVSPGWPGVLAPIEAETSACAACRCACSPGTRLPLMASPRLHGRRGGGTPTSVRVYPRQVGQEQGLAAGQRPGCRRFRGGGVALDGEHLAAGCHAAATFRTSPWCCGARKMVAPGRPWPRAWPGGRCRASPALLNSSSSWPSRQ